MVVAAKTTVVVKVFVIMNYDNVSAFMDILEKDALKNCSWVATFHNHQNNHMGDGLSQSVLLIVTQQEQCASVEKVQNTQIVQWQRRVGFNLNPVHPN